MLVCVCVSENGIYTSIPPYTTHKIASLIEELMMNNWIWGHPILKQTHIYKYIYIYMCIYIIFSAQPKADPAALCHHSPT